MRIHERTQIVDRARLALNHWAIIKEYDLTYVEILGILVEAQGQLLKYMLRAERHPDEPNKKGDEA